MESPAHCEITVHRSPRESRVRGPQVKSTAVKRLARSEMNLTLTEAGVHADGFPNKFCLTYLPCKDEFMTLVDEQGEEFQAKYHVAKTGLSGGWRGFSIYRKLMHGDALVFQLVKPKEFKVNSRTLVYQDIKFTL